MKLVILITLFFLFLTPSTTYASTIKINEFYSTGGSSSVNSDWVEIYNESMDISLYQLIDADNHKKDLSGAICYGHFCTIDWYNLLNKDGDIITLTLKLYPDTPVDQVKYGNLGGITAPGNGQTAGRNPDIIGDWIITSSPTKGESNNSSTPKPTSTSTPTPTPSPTPISTSTPPPASLFTISNVPSQINSDQSFNVSVNLTLPNNKNADYYLSGAFKKTDSTRYFGLTKINTDWIKYDSSNYLHQYKVTTNDNGNWTGILEVKPDISDTDYKGSGDYIFKVARYTSSSSNPTWNNNELTIKIISTDNDSNSASISRVDDTSSEGKPSASVPSINTSVIAPIKNTLLKNNRPDYRIASVAGATASASISASLTPKIDVKNEKQLNPLIWIGSIFILIGIAVVGYIYFQKNDKIHH